ncbi:MAG TPA: AAA family ATPase [Streptosporangiaceae bacterium]|jgi:thymidylate kinase
MIATPCSVPPQVIAIEGLCFAGKTTLARSLADRLNAWLGAEYADMITLPPFPPATAAAARARLSALLAAEAIRARRARAADTRLVIFDRSPLSIVGHEHAMWARGVPADPQAAASWFARAAAAGAILQPDAYLYLTVPGEAFRQRQRNRGQLPEHLIAPDVRSALSEFYTACFQAAGPGRVLSLDGTAPAGSLVGQAAAFATAILAGVPGMPVPWLADPRAGEIPTRAA